MRVNIVNYEQNIGIDAILTKYAKNLKKELIDLGHEATITGQAKEADINHHINFLSYRPSGGKETTMITHLTGDKNHTEKHKTDLVKVQLEVSHGICMNQEIKDKLVKDGCDPKKLSVVLSAHDSLPRRPRVIFIATNIYPDGRKREGMLAELLKTIDPEKFYFVIMGQGWKDTMEIIVENGILGEYYGSFNAKDYQHCLDTSDYMLYTGDEDSLAQSLIDAKQTGVRIIAPPRKEFEVEYPFNNQEELNSIFEKMNENPVKDWTWNNYAKQHIKIWENLYQQKHTK